MDAKNGQAAAIIHSFAATHAIIAFALANTLIGDAIFLTPLTIAMILVLSKLYGVSGISPARILTKTIGYVGGTYIAAKLTFWIPGIGNFANATATTICTETIGWTCVFFFSMGRDPLTVRDSELRDAVKEARERSQKYKEETLNVINKMTDDEKCEVEDLAKQLRDKSLSDNEISAISGKLQAIYERASKR